MSHVPHLLLQLAVILATARVLAFLLGRLGQPDRGAGHGDLVDRLPRPCLCWSARVVPGAGRGGAVHLQAPALPVLKTGIPRSGAWIGGPVLVSPGALSRTPDGTKRERAERLPEHPHTSLRLGHPLRPCADI